MYRMRRFFMILRDKSRALGCYAVNAQNAQFFQDFERQSRALGCYAVNVQNAQFAQGFGVTALLYYTVLYCGDDVRF
jgi:hypothetical protein